GGVTHIQLDPERKVPTVKILPSCGKIPIERSGEEVVIYDIINVTPDAVLVEILILRKTDLRRSCVTPVSLDDQIVVFSDLVPLNYFAIPVLIYEFLLIRIMYLVRLGRPQPTRLA